MIKFLNHESEKRATHRPYILSIDLLRALLAIGVLFYHGLRTTKVGTYSVLGYYCVYGFFVISGISLYVTYYDRITSGKETLSFFIKRVFRIAPLYWFTLIIIAIFFGFRADISKIIWNISLLFGFHDPGYQSVVTGGWSIGIEFVFYALFPLIVWVCKRKLWALIALFVTSLILALTYINMVIDPATPRMTSEIWQAYIQPHTFFVYFVWGCLWGEIYLRLASPQKLLWPAISVIITCLLIFAFVPYDSPLELLSGIKGASLMLTTLALVSAFCFISLGEGIIRYVSMWLGQLSYGIYLLHPQINRALSQQNIDHAAIFLSLSLGLTLIAAWLTYQLLENPMRKFGRFLSCKLHKRRDTA